MSAPTDTKTCLWCAEPIQAAAKICRHCGSYQRKGMVVIGVDRASQFGGAGKEILPMKETSETKPCDMCAEPIRAMAKVCPYCRRLQPKWRFQSQLQAFLPMILILLVFCGGCIWIIRVFGPGRDFEQFRSQIVVVDSQMHFSQITNNNFVSAIGNIRNDSPHGWKELQLEVQYYDKDGRLIDTRTESKFGDALPAGATHAFRVRAPADKPESLYANHKVFVRSARDARKWP